MGKVLLVGNGPNYFSGRFSWVDVVRATAKHSHLLNQTEKIINEPLPLVYETIAGRYPSKERWARKKLADQLRLIPPNDVHRDLMGLGWETVLTNNYDHCLEKATGHKFVSANLAPGSTYSVYRRRRAGSRSVWHIHGFHRFRLGEKHDQSGNVVERPILWDRQDGDRLGLRDAAGMTFRRNKKEVV